MAKFFIGAASVCSFLLLWNWSSKGRLSNRAHAAVKTSVSYLPSDHVSLFSRSSNRVAICFWGVNRALPQTISSIDRNVLNQLTELSIEYNLFFHTYSMRSITSKWAGEINSAIPGALNELSLLSKRNLTRYEITDQSAFDKTSEVSRFTPVPGWDLDVVLNALRALYSLHRVTLLWEAEAHSNNGLDYYRAVIYLRPDLHIMTQLNVSHVLSLGRNDWLSPNWEQVNGINDRLGAGGPRAAKAFGSRIIAARAFSDAGNKFHTETFAKWALDNQKIHIEFFCLCGIRERSNGAISHEECQESKNIIGAPKYSCEEYFPSGTALVNYAG